MMHLHCVGAAAAMASIEALELNIVPVHHCPSIPRFQSGAQQILAALSGLRHAPLHLSM